MFIPFSGYSPDVETTAPGIFTECANVYPTLRGFKGAPTAASVGIDALTDYCRGAVLVTLLDSTRRLFAGTEAAIYELDGSSWIDQSRVGGYTTGTENPWRFCQFGNETIAANKTDTLQSSTSGAFADISGAPKAAIVDSVMGFIMALDTNDGTYGDNPDRWWCCALYDTTDWTPAIATQCATGRLMDIPGAFRAGKRLGDNFIAYKERGMYMGRYVGPPEIWSWTPVPGNVGALSQEAVVNIETAHIFASWDNFYLFDGTRPTPIGNPVKKWFFENLNPRFAYKVKGQHDPSNYLVKFYFPSLESSDGTCDKCLVFNYQVNRWGRHDVSIEAVVEYENGAITYNGGSTSVSTFDATSLFLSFDSPFWTSNAVVPALFNTSHSMVALTGPCAASSFVTGDIGDDYARTLAKSCRMRFQQAPTSATCVHIVKDDLDDVGESRPSVDLVGNKFDLLWSSKWHRLQVNLNGDWEGLGLNPDSTQMGID